jgi:LPXTG-motif cell wall-anchored protein
MNMNSRQSTNATLRKLLTVVAGVAVLATSAALIAQVETKTTTSTGAATKQVTVEKGTVVMVAGHDVWVKDSSNGQIRHFANVPDSVKVTVGGQQLGVTDLKVGMTVERTTVTTTIPKVITTVQTVTGKVFYVNPPTTVILTMDDFKNQEFKVPPGQKFMINGQSTDVFGLKKGMIVSASKVVEVPVTSEMQQKILAGTMPPPPPPPPPDQPILIFVKVKEAPAPAPEVAAAPAPAPALPKTGSPVPFIGLLGLVLLGASFGMRSFRRS